VGGTLLRLKVSETALMLWDAARANNANYALFSM